MLNLAEGFTSTWILQAQITALILTNREFRICYKKMWVLKTSQKKGMTVQTYTNYITEKNPFHQYMDRKYQNITHHMILLQNDTGTDQYRLIYM
jgi:hypothetical protein